MAVPILVVAGHDFGQGGLDVGQVALFFRQGRGVLHQIEHGPGVAVGRRREEIKDLSLRVTERAAVPRLPSSISSGRPSWRSRRTCSRESNWRVHAERGVFRSRGDHGEIAGLQQGEEKILLRL